MQDMKSVYVDICEDIRNTGKNDENRNGEEEIDFSDIEFCLKQMK